MTEQQLVAEINSEITHSCSLPYALPEPEVKRIIKRAREWFYPNYQYAVEDKFIVIPLEIFKHQEFKSSRMIQFPDCVQSVYEFKEMSGLGIIGQPDRDFSDSKLLGAEIFLSPFQGDNLVYRTAMYSYFDLARAYDLVDIAHSFNHNTHRISMLGRTPVRNSYIRACVRIPEESLYDDEIFVRYCLAQAKINLGRILGIFSYNLPGGVQINFDGIKQDGKDELESIMTQINDENSPDWFFQYH